MKKCSRSAWKRFPGRGIVSPARRSRSRVCCRSFSREKFAFSSETEPAEPAPPKASGPTRRRPIFGFSPPRLLPRLRGSLDALSSVLLAARCRLCEELLTSASRVPVCAACLGRVRPLELLAFCNRCQHPLSAAALGPNPTALCGACRQGETDFDCLRSFGAYDAELRALIVLLKYNGVRPLARPLGGWLALVAGQNPGLTEVEALVPVPLHRSREQARGYNQAELLARELSRWTKLRVESGWLRRRRDTPSQTGLTPAQRVENVRGAFSVEAKLDTARILLLDDVCTTGATLNACARALKQAGAAMVNAITLARVVQEI